MRRSPPAGWRKRIRPGREVPPFKCGFPAFAARSSEAQPKGRKLTRRIADVMNELGLQPWKPPEPLDPIEEEEVNLVVWMGVLEAVH